MDGSTANLLRRFLQRAPDALTDEELLTLLLHAGTGAEEPRTLAARLIGQFCSLGAALSASPEELASVEGMDASRALLLRLVTELHRRYYLSRPFSGARLTGTTDFGNFLLPFFYGAREELVYLLALDAAGRLLTCTCLSEGSVNSANVPMRKLMRAALSANASGVVLAHNHPAGIALPSHEDVELTRRLQQALDVVDILLLDHLVIADDDFVSLRDSGYLRLKNVEIGYTLPSAWASKLRCSSLRIYATGVNLFTVSKFISDYWDPETGADAYPMQRQVFVGVNLTF